MIKIDGSWIEGYAFDMHTIKSVYLGRNEFGYDRYKTTRNPMGECLFKLKYRQQKRVINVGEIIQEIISLLSKNDFFKEFINKIEAIIPTPHSNTRRILQPTFFIAKSIAKSFNKEFYPGVLESRNQKQLKYVLHNRRFENLRNMIILKKNFDKNKKILILDDIIQSGATLKTIVETFKENGYNDVYVFALTKTKH